MCPALCTVSCGSYIHIEACVSYICLRHLSSIRYIRVRGKDGVILRCPHEYDVALCSITVKNVALSLLLFGHPCLRESHKFCSH